MNAPCTGCGGLSRRSFLADLGLGFGGVALASIFSGEGIARAGEANASLWTPPDGQPRFAPKAKSVIWIFLSGGYSHLETFDPKPALNAHAGKTFDKAPFENPINSPKQKGRFR